MSERKKIHQEIQWCTMLNHGVEGFTLTAQASHVTQNFSWALLSLPSFVPSQFGKIVKHYVAPRLDRSPVALAQQLEQVRRRERLSMNYKIDLRKKGIADLYLRRSFINRDCHSFNARPPG
jgi:hypothetical protein